MKVNYSCDLDTSTNPNVATCTWDKNVVPAQQATFKYLFLWRPKAPRCERLDVVSPAGLVAARGPGQHLHVARIGRRW